jgi:type I restriction enzyme M protein
LALRNEVLLTETLRSQSVTSSSWGGRRTLPYAFSEQGVGANNYSPLPEYADIPGFCMSAKLELIRKHGHVLTPGHYIGAEAIEDDGEPFEDKMKRLTTLLCQQMEEGKKLDVALEKNLKEPGYGG